MKLLTLWQSFRDLWVMECTSNGFVTDNSAGSNVLAVAMLIELVSICAYVLS